MKNFLKFCFIWGLLVLVACQGDNTRNQASREWMKKNEKLKVLSTTAMINDLVLRVAKDDADTLTLIGGNLDPHSYQLVKGDDEKLAFADIIFYNGLGLEHGASLQNYLTHQPKAIPLGNLIQKKFPEKILYVNQQIDPHLWMDLSLFAEVIPAIVENLSRLRPEHADDFKKNGDALMEELKKIHDEIHAELHEIPAKQRYLVTSHDAFNYFARSYLAEERELSDDSWKERFQAPEGLAPDTQLSSADIKFIIDHLHQYQIRVIFPESNVSQDSIRKIVSAAKAKGIDVVIAQEALYGDAMGGPGTEGDSYPKMLRHNARVISKYLREHTNAK